MRKLLNTLYVTKETGYLSLDGETVVLTESGKKLVALPFSNIESIYCFNYLGCSPALMGKCAQNNVGLCFLTPSGRFLARVVGATKGNVYLRKTQLEKFSDPAVCLDLVKSTISAKVKNVASLLRRSLRDHPEADEEGKVTACLDKFSSSLSVVDSQTDIDVLRGIEGECAKAYFYIFDGLFVKQGEDFKLCGRTKHPPLDRTNAILSFLYTVCTNDIASALECVGLDPYIGFYHTLRPGRVSLACDIMEEFRAVIDRLVLTAVNLRKISKEDFNKEIGGAVLLNDTGRKKVLEMWQSKKREAVKHPFLKEKIQFGLFPYIQANLLAKFVRGELDIYPNLKVE